MPRPKAVILASRSPARRALLRQLGLRFRAVPADLPEASAHRGGCGALVVANARAKARAAARGLRGGVVVAADTVVVVDGRIIGKPADLAEARETLRRISRRPQWVYTGIAVIDVASGRTYTAREKTRVVMRPMGDREIRRYFRRVSPLAMAGSFDIQGLGAVFVERVEGCHYNVVGLPLAALARLLKKAGIEIP